jgi:hypothetical protein
MAKRTTLPKHFEQLLESGDLDQLKAVFDKCDVNARGGFYKHTALAFPKCPDELARWLVERGTDVHAVDQWGRTALHIRATWPSSPLDVLCELGCDVNASAKMSDGTPLHKAAMSHRPEHVATLLAHGADVDVKNDRGQTPLEVALESCRNIDLENVVEIARLLVERGAQKSERAKKALRRVGEQFQFHRSGMDADFAASCTAALAALDEMFGTAPVPPRRMHDGTSPIVAKPGTWREQSAELWKLLVPSSGAAATVQGEVIRIAGRIGDELERNGGVNWDEGYRQMARAFFAYVRTGASLPSAQVAELSELVGSLTRSAEGDTDRLAELAVAWVSLNPKPMPL